MKYGRVGQNMENFQFDKDQIGNRNQIGLSIYSFVGQIHCDDDSCDTMRGRQHIGLPIMWPKIVGFLWWCILNAKRCQNDGHKFNGNEAFDRILNLRYHHLRAAALVFYENS